MKRTLKRLPDRRCWDVLSPLLDELLVLDHERQRLHLAAVRAADPMLADELRWLLAASERLKTTCFLLGCADDDL